MTKQEITQLFENQTLCLTSDMIKNHNYTEQDRKDYGYLKHLKVGDLVACRFQDEPASKYKVSVIETKFENYDSGGGCLLTAYFLKADDDGSYYTRQELVKLSKTDFTLLKLEN